MEKLAIFQSSRSKVKQEICNIIINWEKGKITGARQNSEELMRRLSNL